MTHGHRHEPIAVGGVLAILAAVAFGVTTPLIKRFGAAAGPFSTAATLYAGAAAASFLRRSPREAPLRRAHALRLFGVAMLGAVAAPVCLAWGLKRTSATSASLLLNFEAVFTVVLARLFYAEPIGKRVAIAVGLLVAGGACLVAPGQGTGIGTAGALAVLAASLGWASDNTLTRPLADLDAPRVVLWKGALGACLSALLAWVAGETLPSGVALAGLAACGAVGYGASLRLYLLAQRRIGAARTGSIFAVAPFVGVLAAWAMGERGGEGVTLRAGALFAFAVYLHLTEQHEHLHDHDALEHEHAHRHDDDHHDHVHDAYPEGEHSHRHRHEPRAHAHPHAPDAHHRHEH